MKSQLFKFQVGLAVIGAFVLFLVIFLMVQAGNAKQDTATTKAANTAAGKLNDYVASKSTIPESLDEAGVKDAPKTISYKKLSDSSYKFCVTYKAATKGLEATNVTTAAISTFYGMPIGGSSFTSDNSLYIPSAHKKGQTCQTIKPYVYSSNNYSSSYDTGPYKVCETEYDYWQSFQQVKSVTPKNGSTNASISVGSTGAQTLEISPNAKVFDRDCKPLTLDDIHTGDWVDLYFNPYGSPITTIVKEY